VLLPSPAPLARPGRPELPTAVVLLWNGHGGSGIVRAVDAPSPLGRERTTGGRLTLGITVIRAGVDAAAVTLRLEKGSPLVRTKGAMVKIVVVVLVTNTTVEMPPTVPVDSWPYSNEVVNSPGEMVRADGSGLVGKTSRHVELQETVGDCQTWVPT
jgi:hypothetical protein